MDLAPCAVLPLLPSISSEPWDEGSGTAWRGARGIYAEDPCQCRDTEVTLDRERQIRGSIICLTSPDTYSVKQQDSLVRNPESEQTPCLSPTVPGVHPGPASYAPDPGE